MKKFLLSLLFSFCFLSYEAQNYTPFPEEYGKWFIEKIGPTGPDIDVPHLWYFTRYETAGDTVISGISYKKVFSTIESKGFSPPPANFLTYDFGPMHLAFAYRNDIPSKTVYILTDSNEVINGNLKQEYLWYDFKIEIGDTLKSTYAINWNKNKVDYKRIKVRSIDSIPICGKYGNRFDFTCLNSGILQEGVGFKDNFIRTDIRCSFEPVYQYTTYFFCSPTTIEKEIEPALSVSVFPNPAFHTIKLKWSQIPQQSSVDCVIFDQFGRVVFQKNITDTIDIKNLPIGIYYIAITDKAGKTYRTEFIKQ